MTDIKYQAKLPKDNYNLSSKSITKKSIQFVLGLLFLLVSIQITLIIIANLLSPIVSVNFGKSLGNGIYSYLEKKQDNSEIDNLKAEQIRDKLVAHLDHENLHIFPIKILDQKDLVNAFALPGGTIVVTKELIKVMNNEQELAMIIAHEIGHHEKKHVFKRMFTGLGSALINLLISYNANGSYNTALNNLFTLGYSRRQELQADDFALDLLQKTYGNTNGAAEAFEKLESIERNLDRSREIELFRTHPLTEKRIKRIRKQSN